MKDYKLLKLEKPWILTLRAIKRRCNNPNNNRYYCYGKKGIKCLLKIEDVKYLWFRDKAYLLNKPSIDRENSNKDYTLDNCRFIEHKINSNREKLKPVKQYSLNNMFIKNWNSLNEAARITKIPAGNICNVLKGKRSTAGGFLWRYSH